jgi:hypothetical protein
MSLELLLVVLVGLAGLVFLGGIGFAAYLTKEKRPKEMPAIVASVVTTLSGIMATNFGAVLGLTVGTNNSLARAGFNVLEAETWLERLPIAGVYLYLIGMITAAVCWGVFAGLREGDEVVVSTLPEG